MKVRESQIPLRPEDATELLKLVSERVEQRLVGRKAAADGVLAEIIEPLGTSLDDAGWHVVHVAHLVRARCYLASRTGAVLDAAAAYLAAADAAANLSERLHANDDLVAIGADLVAALVKLESRRRAIRVFSVYVRALSMIGATAEALDGAFAAAPNMARKAVLGGLLPELRQIGAALARLHDSCVTLDQDVRDKRRDILFRIGVLGADDEATLRFRPSLSAISPEDGEALASAIIRTRAADSESVEFLVRLADAQPSAFAALGDSTRRWLRPRSRTHSSELPCLERGNLWARGVWPGEGWPVQHLIRIAARQRQPVAAVAWFAGLADRNMPTGGSPYLVGPLLFRLGFDRTAARIGGPTLKLLVRAEDLLSSGAGIRVLEDFVGGVQRVLDERSIPDSLRAAALRIEGRLLAATGRFDEAARVLECAMARDDQSSAVAVDLAEVLVAKGDRRRARAFVDVAEAGRRSIRLGEIKAALLEQDGNFVEAAAALLEVLDRHGKPRGEPDAWVAAQLEKVEESFRALWGAAPESSLFLAELRGELEECQGNEERPLSTPDVIRRRALILADRGGDGPLALRLAEPWIDRILHEPTLASIVARARLRCGDASAALATLDPHGADAEGATGVRALALWQLERQEDALALLRASDCASVGAMLAHAAMLAAYDRVPEAMSVLERAVDEGLGTQEAQARLLSLLGLLQERSGEDLAAIDSYARSLELCERIATRRDYVRMTAVLGLREPPRSALARELFENTHAAIEAAPEGQDDVWGAIALTALGRTGPFSPEDLEKAILASAHEASETDVERRRLGLWIAHLEAAGDWRRAARVARAAESLLGRAVHAGISWRAMLRIAADDESPPDARGRFDPGGVAAAGANGRALVAINGVLSGVPVPFPEPDDALSIELQRGLAWASVLGTDPAPVHVHVAALAARGHEIEASLAERTHARDFAQDLTVLIAQLREAGNPLPFEFATCRLAALRLAALEGEGREVTIHDDDRGHVVTRLAEGLAELRRARAATTPEDLRSLAERACDHLEGFPDLKAELISAVDAATAPAVESPP